MVGVAVQVLDIGGAPAMVEGKLYLLPALSGDCYLCLNNSGFHVLPLFTGRDEHIVPAIILVFNNLVSCLMISCRFNLPF